MSFSSKDNININDNPIINENDINKLDEENISEEKQEEFDKDKIYELKYIKFLIKDYSSFPRTERAKLVMYLLNVPMKISELEQKFGYIIHALKFSPEPKNFDNSIKIIITKKTDICFYYLEYRLLFFFDLSQSMLLFDLRQKIFNIQKMEKYLNILLKNCAEYEDTLYNFNIEKIHYKPKIICTIACGSDEKDIIFLKHAFILEKENFDNFYSKEISNKINLILMKSNDRKRPQNNETLKEVLFLYKILENCLLTFNLMPSFGNRILFFLTDGNIFLPNLGKYNNILMKINRGDISIQIIDLFYRNNCYGLTSPKFVNDIEIMKYLARFTGGNYINENFLIELFFQKEKERNGKNKKDIFFYPSLYPNILNYNLNEEESLTLWGKRFTDIFGEKQVHCDICSMGFELFLCKKIVVKNKQKNKKEVVLDNNKNKVENLINKGINIKSVGLLSNYKIKVINKELFESYNLSLSLALIIESRIRESFYLKKTKNPKKIKFIMYFLPGIEIKYNLTKLNDDLLCRDYKVDIIIKGEICKMTQMKKELYKKNGECKKAELLLNFIKQIICTDKITLYFSQIAHHNKFLNNDFFAENKNYMTKFSTIPVQNWHRFFNVMMCEVFIIDKTVVIDKEIIQNFLKSPESVDKINKKKKEYLQKKILSFCDCYDEEINFGIKRIDKEENKLSDFAHNAFLLINFEWSYNNLCLIYLGFFHCFLSIRNKYLNKIKEHILDNNIGEYNDEYYMECNNGKHLAYFITGSNEEFNLNDNPDKNNSNIDNKKASNPLRNKLNTLHSAIKQIEDNKKIGNNIFTYSASEKLVDVYLKKYPIFFEVPSNSDTALRNILENLIIQRLKEKFEILNWDSKYIIFFSYLTNLNIDINIKNSSLDNIKNNQLLNNIIVLYSIKINDQNNKNLVIANLIFEPNENLYILTDDKVDNSNGDNIEQKYNSYFLSIMKHFNDDELRIKNSLKINDIE